MAPRKGAKKPASKAYAFPDKIAQGQILTDVTRKQWRLGKSIGRGGFGEIYLASDIINKPVGDNANFVIKIEPHSNGPLFTEMHCYMRIAKPDFIENWKKEKKLKRLGMPKYLGSGSHEYQGQKYRFMVMERFGDDLQKIIERHNKKFSYKTVFQVVIQILDVLEYIHSYEYIHADIKASNLLVGYQPGTENQVFLVDYGLACRYKIDGKHKEYKYDQRKAHDGTIEFTSRDAHIGAHSRRGDLEILGYNLVQWLCGKLPWEDNLKDCNYVANKKRALMEDVPKFMNICFPDGIPPGIQEYVEYIASLAFDEQPDYEKCRIILREGLKKRGYKDDGKMVFMSATPKASSKIPASKLVGRKVSHGKEIEESNAEVEEVSPPPAKMRRRTQSIGVEVVSTDMPLSVKLEKPSPKIKGTLSVSKGLCKAKQKAWTSQRASKDRAAKKKTDTEAKDSSLVGKRKIVTQKTKSFLSGKGKKTSLSQAHSSKSSRPVTSQVSLSSADLPKSGNSASRKVSLVMADFPEAGRLPASDRVPSQKRSTLKGSKSKTAQAKTRVCRQKRTVRNGNVNSFTSSTDNPTPHMLALMERIKKK